MASEKTPLKPSRFTEKNFKDVLGLEKDEIARIRRMAAEIWLDENDELKSERGGKSVPAGFTNKDGKNYVDTCALRLESVLRDESLDLRANCDDEEEFMTAMRALIFTGVNKHKQVSKPTAGKISTPSTPKTARKKGQLSTSDLDDEDEAPRNATPSKSKPTAAKATSNSAKSAQKKPSVAMQKPTEAVKQVSEERQASPAQSEESVAKEEPVALNEPKRTSVIPAKRGQADTPISSAFAGVASALPSELPYGIQTHGISPQKIQRLSSAIMKAHPVIGNAYTEKLVGHTGAGDLFIPPTAIDTLTETLLTVTEMHAAIGPARKDTGIAKSLGQLQTDESQQTEAGKTETEVIEEDRIGEKDIDEGSPKIEAGTSL